MSAAEAAVVLPRGETAAAAPRTVFMFSGQGSHYFQMGRQLYESNPVFRAWMTRLDELAFHLGGQHVVPAIYAGGKAEVFDRTRLTHPAIFILQYSLAQCLMEEGVKPGLCLGTSLGSFAAAAVSGHVDVLHALAAVIEQARAFEATCERGGMIAILADPALHDEPFLRERSEVAGVNFDGHFVVSAGQADLEPLEAALKQRGVVHQRLAVSFAYHSRRVDAAQERFLSFMRAVPRCRATAPLVCCEQGRTVAGELPDDFFWRVVRHPIRFRDAVRHLERQGPHRYIDVGPSGTLATFVKHGLPAGSTSSAHAVLTPYGQDLRNLAALAAARS
jgi:bacillaene synthase trans-acting acyltransferase